MSTFGATSSVKTKQLADLVECGICLEIYNDPRSLPFVHTYCLPCIEGLCRDEQPGDEVACPQCRTPFQIPQGGVQKLPKNFFMDNLKQLSGLSIGQNHSSLCDACNASDAKPAEQKKTANVFCKECCEKLCTDCAVLHKTFRMSKSHSIIKLEALTDTDLIAANVPLLCDAHSSKPIELYCEDCASCICVLCYVELHNSHKCSHIDKIADVFRDQMRKNVTGLNDVLEKCNTMRGDVARIKIQLVEQVERLMTEVDNKANEMKRIVDSHRTMNFNKLEDFKQTRLKEIERVSDCLDQHVSSIEIMKTYSEQLSERGSACDVARDSGNVNERTRELTEISSIQTARESLSFIKLDFEARQLTIESNLIGDIVMTTVDANPEENLNPNEDRQKESEDAETCEAALAEDDLEDPYAYK